MHSSAGPGGELCAQCCVGCADPQRWGWAVKRWEPLAPLCAQMSWEEIKVSMLEELKSLIPNAGFQTIFGEEFFYCFCEYSLRETFLLICAVGFRGLPPRHLQTCSQLARAWAWRFAAVC